MPGRFGGVLLVFLPLLAAAGKAESEPNRQRAAFQGSLQLSEVPKWRLVPQSLFIAIGVFLAVLVLAVVIGRKLCVPKPRRPGGSDNADLKVLMRSTKGEDLSPREWSKAVKFEKFRDSEAP